MKTRIYLNLGVVLPHLLGEMFRTMFGGSNFIDFFLLLVETFVNFQDNLVDFSQFWSRLVIFSQI